MRPKLRKVRRLCVGLVISHLSDALCGAVGQGLSRRTGFDDITAVESLKLAIVAQLLAAWQRTASSWLQDRAISASLNPARASASISSEVMEEPDSQPGSANTGAANIVAPAAEQLGGVKPELELAVYAETQED